MISIKNPKYVQAAVTALLKAVSDTEAPSWGASLDLSVRRYVPNEEFTPKHTLRRLSLRPSLSADGAAMQFRSEEEMNLDAWFAPTHYTGETADPGLYRLSIARIEQVDFVRRCKCVRIWFTDADGIRCCIGMIFGIVLIKNVSEACVAALAEAGMRKEQTGYFKNSAEMWGKRVARWTEQHSKERTHE